MREIKFRAWYPLLKRMLPNVGVNKGDILCDTRWYQSSSVELMQYTGLKDKNGREIYEGDIVHYLAKIYEGNEYREEEINAVVEFEFGSFVGNPKNSNYDTNLQGSELWMEVVGNIYENPELAPA